MHTLPRTEEYLNLLPLEGVVEGGALRGLTAAAIYTPIQKRVTVSSQAE